MRIVALDTLQQFAAVNLRLDPGAIGGPVVIPQAAQITIQWTLGNGKVGNNVLYGRYSGTFAGTTAQANALKTAFTTGALWTAVAAHIAPGSGIQAVTIRDVNSAFQPIISSTVSLVPGTSTGTALPDEVAVCVTLRTSLAGPGARGRFYVPGLATTALGAGNVINAAAVTAIQNWADAAVRVGINNNGYTMVLGLQARASYTGSTGTVHPARAATTLPVNGCFVRDNHWDTQRRRGLK